MIYVTLLVALGLGALFVWFRVAPVVKGKAVPGETPDERLLKWNSLIVPYVRKQMREGVLVGLGSFFESARDGRPKTMAVWGLLPTLLPDVDFIALAQPGAEATDEAEVLAVTRADDLRALLGHSSVSQDMFGHPSWLYVWPPEIDLGEVVARLMPVDEFRHLHGLDNPHQEEEVES